MRSSATSALAAAATVFALHGCGADEAMIGTQPDDASVPPTDASIRPTDANAADAAIDASIPPSDANTDATDAEAPPTTGYDVFLLAGQSNMVGRGQPADAELDAVHPAIFQWGRGGQREGQIVPATARLDHNDDALLDRVGLGLSFAKAYYAATSTPRPILLVPTARGGSSFSANQWNPGDPLFEDAVARTNAAMATDPGNRLRGVLWHQGENDVDAYDTATHAAALDAQIGALRTRITGAATTPFVLGQFCPDWQASPAGRAAITAAIDATPSRVPFAAVAPAAGLHGNVGDLIHFDAPSLRMYGARYAEALLDARERSAPLP